MLIYNNSKCILKNREGAIKMLFSYDKTLGTVETSQGTMTLTKVFIPFFLEMFLMNFMQTVNTFMLSYFSDNAVAPWVLPVSFPA